MAKQISNRRAKMNPLDRLYDERWYKIRNSNKMDWDQRAAACERLETWYQKELAKVAK